MTKRTRIISTITLASLTLTLLALVALLTARPSRAQEEEPEAPALENDRFITVRGQGRVLAQPDQATVRFGVVTQAPTATAALEENRALMQEVISATVALDIPEEQIQTEILRLEPLFEERREPEPVLGPREITGYEARNVVSVTVEDMDRIGAVLDAATGAGANVVEGISFEIGDRAELLATARRQAMRDAMDKAETLADVVEAEIGAVLVIREQGTGGPPVAFAEEDALARSAAFPVQPGQQAIEVSVEVTWELES
ncbi:MAG: SIMPL domain-containing protein [Candidatus Promineifilaceae bacterium]|nr:SIMPL domain-containing protein [Candidatus Promineifilaceae bacterium]